MWSNFAIAFGLMLVMEGIGPFLNPAAMRRVFMTAAGLEDGTLRVLGLVSMLAGVVLLYLVN